MSILLNALKKSEQQRQLGTTPTLSTPVEGPAPYAQDERRWLPLSMMVFSAIVMGWIGWNQYRPPFSVMPALIQAQGKAGVEEPPAEQAVVSEADSESRTPVETFQAGETAAEDAVVAADPAPADPDQLQQLGESFRSFRAESDSEDPNAAGPLETAEAPPMDERPEELAGTDGPGRATAPRTAMEPHIPEPISYWEVPQSVRESMPEFNISVLVFAENPEDRFLLINGQRLVEKEDFMSGVRLDEIRRDGAVFIYRNYRFLVKG